MHYPLHTMWLFVSLLIPRDNVNAGKASINADVLTSFAKNVASVLSTTLLGDYQNLTSNQSLPGLLKRIQALDLDRDRSDNSDVSSKTSFGRYARNIREQPPPSQEREAYQDAYITNAPNYPQNYNSEVNHEYPMYSNPKVPLNQINVEASKNIPTDNRDNFIDAEIKTVPVDYSNQHQHPTEFRYKPEPVHRSPTPNQYNQFNPQPQTIPNQYNQFNPQPQPTPNQYNQFSPRPQPTPNQFNQFALQYHRSRPQTPVSSEQSPAERISALIDDNLQAARITRRPINLNYQGQFPVTYQPQLQGQPEFYPEVRPIEGEGQPATSNGGQDDRPVDDQTQGQSTFGGYEYGPHFHYGAPYPDGFYPGYPGFYPRPFNESFNPAEQGNNTLPFGPPFYDPKFGPYFGPYYPNFYGKPAEPGQGNSEQVQNGQGYENATANRPPFGFPPYGPYYGGFPFPGYPLAPFNGLPYHFGHGFHGYLLPKIKPYFNYPYFPLAYPYGGYYPYNNNRPTMSDKPMDMTQTGKVPAPNSEAEVLSESKAEMLRSLGLNRYGQRSSGFVAKEREKVMHRAPN